MTAHDAAGDLADVAGIPHVTLDGDGLDVLELALGGALSELPPLPGVPAGAEVVLTDAENTPLAHLRGADAGGPALIAIRPLPHGTGLRWDPSLRRPAPEVRRAVRAMIGDDQVLAIVVDEPPTVRDRQAALDAIGRSSAAAVLCVMPVARHRPSAGTVGPAGVVRAGTAFAAELAAAVATTLEPAADDARPDIPVIPLVVPWPGPPPRGEGPGLDLGDVLAAFGANETIHLAALRDDDERVRLSALPDAFEREVHALYPRASAAEVIRAAGQRRQRGAVIFFTGLSGSGKSTIARALADDLADLDGHRVTLLDGDDVRRSLTADLGFDARSRELNIERIAYVASLIAAHGGIAIAATITPFAAGRRRARELAEPHGAFLLVFVDTPLEVCEARDRKGLYARARAGLVADFTGITSPYEEPDDADVVIDTTDMDVGLAVEAVRAALERALEAPGPAAD